MQGSPPWQAKLEENRQKNLEACFACCSFFGCMWRGAHSLRAEFHLQLGLWLHTHALAFLPWPGSAFVQSSWAAFSSSVLVFSCSFTLMVCMCWQEASSMHGGADSTAASHGDGDWDLLNAEEDSCHISNPKSCALSPRNLKLTKPLPCCIELLLTLGPA